VTEAVLDASVILKWFHVEGEGEGKVAASRALRTRFETGELTVFAPRLLHLEILNIAARRWHWQRPGLVELVRALSDLPFELREPELATVAEWTARGLTAYDASYVAVAESQSTHLITDDHLVLTIAHDVARPLDG